MTEDNKTQDEDSQSDGQTNDLKDQFRNLGENIKNVLNGAWDSQERQNVQQEIQDGLNEVGEILDGLVAGVRESEPGKKFVEGMDDLSEKYQTGEMQAQVRESLVSAMDSLNANLKKASDTFSSKNKDEE